MSNEKLAERQRFEEWYATHATHYFRDPIGSRDCALQWEAWYAALQAHAAEAAQPMTPRELADRIARGEKWKLAAAAPQQAAEPFCWWRQVQDCTDEYVTEYSQDSERPKGAGWEPLYTHPQPAQDAKLPSDEDFRLHLGELTPAELRVAQAAARYVLAGTAQDAKDAARYRWLKKNDNCDLLAEDVIDEAIVAMAKESGR